MVALRGCLRDDAHLTYGGVAPQTSDTRGSPFAGRHHDPDPARYDEMHRVGGFSRAGDDLRQP